MVKKVALITGASRGIGNAIAENLAKSGYFIAVTDIRPLCDCEENIQNIKETGAEVIYLQGDISSEKDRERVFAELMEHYGRLDVMVNNAGVAPRIRADILETTEESVNFVLNINLKGTFFMSQKAAGVMIGCLEKKLPEYAPKIINISSMSAYTSSVNRGEYCISKAGISMVTKLFADRLAEYGINVYEIRPGIIATDMTSTVKDKYDKLIAEGVTPIKRWGYPQDIANAIVAICSGAFGFSTGEVFNIDGGFHLRRL